MGGAGGSASPNSYSIITFLLQSDFLTFLTGDFGRFCIRRIDANFSTMTLPIEIERRFLVVNDGWRGAAGAPKQIRQGYLPVDGHLTMRVRRMDDRGFLTIKTAKAGASRTELEYEIPCDHAEFLLASVCQDRLLEKLRYTLDYGGLTWVIDEFSGANRGLAIAEAEMDGPGQHMPLPPWVGPEVTGCEQFQNSVLARHPIAAPNIIPSR